MRLFVAAFLLLGLAAASSAANAAANDRARMTPAAADPAETWPRWRGPSGQGDVVGSGYVDRWGPEENVRWKVAVPGKGNSSPIVWGDRIFLTTAEAAGAKRSVLAFDRATGERLWTTAAPNANPERAYPERTDTPPRLRQPTASGSTPTSATTACWRSTWTARSSGTSRSAS